MNPQERLRDIENIPYALKAHTEWLIQRIKHLEKGYRRIQEIDDTGTGGYIEDTVSCALNGDEYPEHE